MNSPLLGDSLRIESLLMRFARDWHNESIRGVRIMSRFRRSLSILHAFDTQIELASAATFWEAHKTSWRVWG
jgi:hypothetical protein